MKPVHLIYIFILLAGTSGIKAETVEKTYLFDQYSIEKSGNYALFCIPGLKLSGIPGEPVLPWQKVCLILPPGEEAVSIEVIREEPSGVQGKILLQPAQRVQPLSVPDTGSLMFSPAVYHADINYPENVSGPVMTQYLYGSGFAMAAITPVSYNPAKQKLTWFRKVTVKIHTRPSANALNALKNCSHSATARERIRRLAQNPEMESTSLQMSQQTSYDYLILCPAAFKNEFTQLTGMHNAMGRSVRVITTDSVSSTTSGYDLQEKLRNFIKNQYQNHGISYVLLAGNPPLIPARGFYCYVMSGTTPYTDSNIPADLYYSGMDGNYDANGNHIYAEVADNPDLLPEISVGRFTVNDTSELRKMIRKTIAYRTNPVRENFAKPMMAGEYLTNQPMTFGRDYLELLIGDHSDNGYFSHGIPSATNQMVKLYDTLISPPLNLYQWSASLLLSTINQGTSFIHHLGHANTTYMMRLSINAITNANFSQVNGVIHNFQLLYTQGCYDGAFDQGCIGAKAVKIDNFLVAGVFNSRYGWFNQGTTDGPSQHLHREFVSALYHDTLPDKQIGNAHLISKLETAPWVGLPGEFEPGAQRWCHYCCNVFGDPALEIWTEEPTGFIEYTWTGAIDGNWLNPANWNYGLVPGSACNVTIPASPHDPVISLNGNHVCNNLTITGTGNLSIAPGKSVLVHGSVILAEE